MNQQTAENAADAIAENVWVRIFSRFGMLVATFIILPMGVYLMQSAISQLRELQDSIVQMQQDQAVAKVVQDQIQVQVNDRTSDLYTNSLATRDWSAQAARDAVQDQNATRLEQHLNSTDARVHALEQVSR